MYKRDRTLTTFREKSSMSQEEQRGFGTRSLHTQIPYLHPNPHVMPPYLTSTYAVQSLDPPLDQEFPFKYGRIGHPNGILLEHTLASLEGGEAAFVTADGMRAISLAISSTLHQKKGTIVSTSPLYSDTYQLFNHNYAKGNKRYIFLHSDPCAVDEFKKIIKHAQTLKAPVELLFIETPANPTLTIWNIKTLCQLAHEYNIRVIVDNTFATPYNQRPLELGADLVIHSLTKYCCGNGTTLGGAIIGPFDRITKIRERSQREGGHMHPMAAWLIQLGLQTLELRMRRHNANALALSSFLQKKQNISSISHIYYPGLASFDEYTIACDQMRTPNGDPGFGGMVSFELSRIELIKPFAQALANNSFIELAVSLGSTTSTFSVPARQIHASLSPTERTALGISDTLIRFSVGIENIQDIIYAVESALNAIA